MLPCILNAEPFIQKSCLSKIFNHQNFLFIFYQIMHVCVRFNEEHYNFVNIYVKMKTPVQWLAFSFQKDGNILHVSTLQTQHEGIYCDESFRTSVIRIFALKASALRGSSIYSDVVSPVKATSGDNIVSVIWKGEYKINTRLINSVHWRWMKNCYVDITNLNTRLLQFLNLFPFQMHVLLLQFFSNRVDNITLRKIYKKRQHIIYRFSAFLGSKYLL